MILLKQIKFPYKEVSNYDLCWLFFSFINALIQKLKKICKITRK